MIALKQTERQSDQPATRDLSMELTNSERNLLNHLRLVGLSCRTAAREDLFEACRVLSTDKATSAGAHSKALMKCLSQALEKRPRFLRPGEDSLSFDEAWMVRLARSVTVGDDASFVFLLASRVTETQRRNVAFLIRSVVRDEA